MGSTTISSIVISLIGGLISLLFAALAFFIIRSYNAIDSNMGRHAESINALVLNIKDLANAIANFGIKHEMSDRTLKEHHEEIEMLRERSHDMDQEISFILLQGQSRNSWPSYDGSRRKLASVRPAK